MLPAVTTIAERHPERTIFTRFLTPHDPVDLPGQWQAYYQKWRHTTRRRLAPDLLDLAPPLARLVPPGKIADKLIYSPFSGSCLGALLEEMEAETLVVTGTETDVCVMATVIGAIDLGYRVIVVSDAVCSSSDEGHDALMTTYRSRFSTQIDVATTAEVLSAWRERP